MMIILKQGMYNLCTRRMIGTNYFPELSNRSRNDSNCNNSSNAGQFSGH